MCVYKEKVPVCICSEWHNFGWDLDKPLSRFGINPAVPLCDPSIGLAHQRLKVNAGANQLSSQKHSASTSHCAINAHTLVYVCMHTPAHAVDPHPSCTGGHDLMYQYWESNEAEDAWPLTAAADQLKLCVGFIGWRWCTCGADEGFKSKACAFKKGWKWKLTACWWLYAQRHLVLCKNAKYRDLFLTPMGIEWSFNANKISILEIVFKKGKKASLNPYAHIFLLSICSCTASHGKTGWLFLCLQSLFLKTNHRICLEFKYVSAWEKHL